MVIAFEGPSRAGKTTVCRELTKMILSKGIQAVDLNDILVKDLMLVKLQEITKNMAFKISPFEELSLYCVRLARKIKYIRDIEKSSSKQTIILVDRFSWSILIFFVMVRKMDEAFIRNVIKYATEGIHADFTVCLDAELKTIIQREYRLKRSRKNLNLENFIDEYRKSLRGLVEKSMHSILIKTDQMNVDEIVRNVFGKITSHYKGGYHGPSSERCF